jgi:hypothetical protein
MSLRGMRMASCEQTTTRLLCVFAWAGYNHPALADVGEGNIIPHVTDATESPVTA